MILRVPIGFGEAIGDLSQELKKNLVELIDARTHSRDEVFDSLDEIVNRYVKKNPSLAFEVFAHRWLLKIKYLYLVSTSAEPRELEMVINQYSTLGELNLLDWVRYATGTCRVDGNERFAR